MDLNWLRKLAGLPLRRQLALAAAALGVLLVAALWLAWSEYRAAHFGEGHAAAATELRMLSQRLGRAALLGLRGDAEAFPQIQASRDAFEAAIGRVTREDRAPREREALVALWARAEKNAATLLRDQKLLVALASAAAELERGNAGLLEHAEEVQNLKLARAAPASEVAAASRLVMLSQRMARGAQQLVAADQVAPEVEFLLGKDVNEFRATLGELRKQARDEASTRAVEALAARFAPAQDAIVAVLGTRERLVGAKDAAAQLNADAERLLEAVDRYVSAARGGLAGLADQTALAATAAALAGVFVLLGLLFVLDERRGRESAARRLAAMRRHHERDLQAVDELRRELEPLASGDLSGRVAVGSEITYPAAAALNDALDGLRARVARIGHAAERVGGAAGSAQEAADTLLGAARLQSERVKDASARSLGMARAVTDLSARSNRAAELAHGSLNAAVQGRQAVQAALSVVGDLGRRVRGVAESIERGHAPEPAKLAGLLLQIATQAEALGASASGRTLSDLGERLRALTENVGEVSRIAQSQGSAASAIAGGVRETLSGAEQGAAAAMRAASAVEEVAGVMRELQEALEALHY